MFSRRSAVSTESNQFSRERERLRHDAECIDWTLSNPTRAGLDYDAYRLSSPPQRSTAPSPASLVEAGAGGTEEHAAWHSHTLAELRHEPDPLGDLQAREAICRAWHGPRAPRPEQVQLLPSTSQAYQFLFLLLCDPGDEVLAPEPSYPLFADLARYSDVQLRPYGLSYDGAWHLEGGSLRPGPRCRAVIAVHPNNPTGSYLSASEWQALAALGLPLISDEVFARYFLTKAPAVASALGFTSQLTFCLDGLSKSAGMPHAKLSWIATSGPDAECQESLRRLSFLADTFLPTGSVVQLAAPRLLESSRHFRSALLHRLRANLALLQQALQGSAATLLRPEGGWTFVLRLPDVLSDEQWCELLMHQEQLILYPGYLFDIPGPPHAVGSLLLPEPAFAQACRRLRRLIEQQVL